MKYLITENRLHKLVDKIFIDRYNGLLRKEVNDDGYIYLYDLENDVPFEVNMGGTLWVGDYILYKKIRSVFGFNNSEEVDEFFKNYFNDRYDLDVKRVASEGGYHRGGDDLDDADPWLDEFDNEPVINEQQNEKIVKTIIKYLDSNLTPYNGWKLTKDYEKEIGYQGGELFLSLTQSEGNGEDDHLWYSECENENLSELMPEGHCPVVMIDSPYGAFLDGYFGDLWRPVFKKWFKHHTGLPVVQVDNY